MGIGAAIAPGSVLAFVGSRVALFLIALAVTGALTCGCREHANCNRQTDAWRCSPAGRPERCAEGNVWRSYAYGPCSLNGERCVSVPGAAFCVPADASVALPTPPTADASASQE